jgi:tryptophan synthase alpha chain
VSLKGVTGASNLDAQAVCERLQTLRRLVHVPLGVGFGIRDAAGAAAVAQCADAVVIGSRIIELMEHQPAAAGVRAAADFVRSIRMAIDASASATAAA